MDDTGWCCPPARRFLFGAIRMKQKSHMYRYNYKDGYNLSITCEKGCKTPTLQLLISTKFGFHLVL